MYVLTKEQLIAVSYTHLADEITLSDDALAELRRAVLVEELDGLVFLNPEMCIRDRLQAVVNDMCSYTTSAGTKDVEETDADGNVTTVTKSVLYVNVTLKSYILPLYFALH